MPLGYGEDVKQTELFVVTHNTNVIHCRKELNLPASTVVYYNREREHKTENKKQ
jgi:hypothetical protein